MAQGTTTGCPAIVQHSTAHASLAALGVPLRHLDLFGPIREQVHIAQKTVRYTPTDKLYDACSARLAGAHGLVEINGRRRPDPALQAAFGRCACAEQAGVQDTLAACTAETVRQLAAAWTTISRRHRQGSRHPAQTDWQILDVDLSGLPCGKNAALATAGYFAKQRTRRGRHLGRGLATRSREIVVDRRFDGKTQLNTALLPLVVAAEAPLDRDAAKREHTLGRIDAGAGSSSDRNGLLLRGYCVVTKDSATARARLLAAQVRDWLVDPQDGERQVGLVPVPASDYPAGQYRRPITRVAVRSRLANGAWGVGVVVSSLSVADACARAGLDATAASDPLLGLLAYVSRYDQRGGGVETSCKEAKQGLGITKRSTKRFAAQQVVALLGARAHNVWCWAKRGVVARAPAIQRLGIKRLLRDVFGINGRVHVDRAGHVRQIILNQANRLARHLLLALQERTSSAGVAVILGET